MTTFNVDVQFTKRGYCRCGIIARVMVAVVLPTVIVLVAVVTTRSSESNVFSKDFAWGVYSAAYQIEGAWDADGKGESIWDVFTQTKGGDNGNISANSYHLYRRHMEHFVELNVTHYKFSISWSRVLPDGTLRSRNNAGIQYYRDLITELLRYKVKLTACLYHHDLPQALQSHGGWMNESMVDRFEEYARLMFTELGDSIKYWVTMTSPWNDAYRGHGDASFAPGISQPETAPYIVAHNMIRAHVRAYHVYNDEFKAKQQGRIGIVLNTDWHVPATSSESEVAARAMMFSLGWFAKPIFGNGDYPDVMKNRIAALSLPGNSRLPSFTTEEISRNKGSSDFFGISKETTFLVLGNISSVSTDVGYMKDIGVKESAIFSSEEHVTDMLLWIKANYNSPLVYVFDAGYGDCGTLYDEERLKYMKQTIAGLRSAVSQGVRLGGYFAQLMDGFDWTRGYKLKHGLYHTEFKNGGRLQKSSARYYRTLIRHWGNDFENPKHFTPEVIRQKDFFLRAKFPPDFHWGVATAAFQIEGAWNESGKSPSVWDTFAHNYRLANGTTGDVACDSYHKYKVDVQNVKRLGVSHYRFSLAWTRILPDGRLSSLNKAGVEYYNNLINELLANGIKPMVTIYHWDMPQALDSLGGFLNPSIIDYFYDYAKVCFEQFGDRVPLWVTFNEPIEIAWAGYGTGLYPPGIKNPTTGPYQAGHNIIKAHVKVYHMYNQLFKARFHGKVGIVLNSSRKEAANTDALTMIAAERSQQFDLGTFANPIFGDGDYPYIVRQQLNMKSREEGRNASRLPVFTEEEIKMNKGSADFFGLNHYTTRYVMHKRGFGEQDRYTKLDDCWPLGVADWLNVNPWGLRSLLRWIRDHYNNPPLYVTENGFADEGGLDDHDRIQYIKGYTNEVLKAIHFDNCNVKGYIAWALMDTVEWIWAYNHKFGLYSTNFTDPDKTRTIKASGQFFSQLVRDNGY